MMNIEAILTEWKKDSEVNMNNLGSDVANVSNLHAKYIEVYVKERAKLFKLKSDYAEIKKLRWEYWSGITSLDTLKEKNWPPQPLKLLKADIPMYLESDDVLREWNMRISFQEEKIALLDSIIKNINSRGYNIRAAIDYVKFKTGN